MTDIVIFNSTMALAGASAAGAGSGVYLALTDVVQGQIITGTVTIVGVALTTYFAYRAKVLSQESKDISHETHSKVNGQMEAFKKLFEEYFVEKGVAQEKAAEAVRQSAATIAHAAGVQEQKAKESIP